MTCLALTVDYPCLNGVLFARLEAHEHWVGQYTQAC